MSKVLIVDDEPMVLTLLSRVLRNAGYQTIQVSSAEEALQVCAHHKGEIDVLLTDLKMPGLSGNELATRVVTERPGTPVVYMSGYCDRAVAGQDALGGATAFLQKPFSRTALLETLGRALAAANSAGAAESARAAAAG